MINQENNSRALSPEFRENTGSEFENRSILVIDDDQIMLTSLGHLLSKSGFNVLSANSGTKGLEMARYRRPDLILLDIMLPDVSGLELCRMIKNDPALSTTRIIMISGMKVSPTDQAQGLNAGADGYMIKPLHAQELLARIRTLLRSRIIEEELEDKEKALQKAQLQWQETFDSISDPIVILDKGHRIMQANKEFLHSLGLDLEQIRGRQCSSLACTEENPFDEFPDLGMLENDLELTKEIFSKTLGGHFLVKVTPMTDHKGLITGYVHVARNISSLKATQDQLNKVSNEYEKVFHGTQDALFLMQVENETTFRFIRNNLFHQQATGLTLEALRGKTPQDLLGQKVGSLVAANYKKCLDAGESVSYEEKLSLPGGERVWSTTLTPVFQNDKITHIVGSAQDITERKRAEERLRYLATTDELTGLWNRRHFMDTLNKEMERARRYNQRFSLIMLDIDHFKKINDQYGHDAGDSILEHLAGLVKKHLRQVDVPGRLGGEEFAIILPQTDMNGAYMMAERLRTAMEETSFNYDQTVIKFTISLGVAEYQLDSLHQDQLLKMADAALYQAKKQGRNQTVRAETL
ncbi:GGDEF domain-containing response regulator [Desulfonatronovibrio hydrogenovorans]|uniref:GGDEF domain-containing response regulator n=1 Tax=Desulfonatronovibrio hydrogenovorans TaxID=53245 RepID=UPI00068CE69C|nr:diguanylate cyclase [Desulfonatronovibrio hydrogenovorans]